MNTVVAFIPARAGSKRISDKNIRLLNGHPLMAYSIQAACESGVFDAVIVATDSEKYATIASYYGAEVPFLRPQSISSEVSPDIEWVRFMLEGLKVDGRSYDFFSILRPTSPFRMPETIRRAWDLFRDRHDIDSLRAVEKCTQHPGKMWTIANDVMTPVMPGEINGQPFHSNQYQALPEIYVQNASLEIAKSSVVSIDGTISGKKIMPFITEGHEGFDVNSMYDWELGEKMVVSNEGVLPQITKEPFCEG